MCRKCKNFLVSHCFSISFDSLSLHDSGRLFLFYFAYFFIHKNLNSIQKTDRIVNSERLFFQSLHTHCLTLPNIIIEFGIRSRNKLGTIITMNLNGFMRREGRSVFYDSFILSLSTRSERKKKERTIEIDTMRKKNRMSHNIIKISNIMFDLKGFSSLCRKIDTNTIWFIQAFLSLVHSFVRFIHSAAFFSFFSQKNFVLGALHVFS